MAKLLYSATMSLDGYIAGPGGDMSWLTEHMGVLDSTTDRLLAQVGAVLVGNNTFGGADPNEGTDKEGAFGGQYTGPTFVLTHQPPAEPIDGVTFVGDLDTAVALASAAAGDHYVHILGANVARQCIEANLLDEVLVLIAPVLLGDGTRLFERPGGPQVRLEPLTGESAHWYGVVR